jgi:peptide/nickel transport system permease protein
MIIEATLSFLGIGLPPEYPGWGKMILSFHNYPEYWWLLVFPGLLIFINAISIQQIGRYFEFKKVKL